MIQNYSNKDVYKAGTTVNKKSERDRRDLELTVNGETKEIGR